MFVLIVTSAVVSYAVHYFTDENKSYSEQNNLLGDLFSSALFLLMICLLNSHNFDPKSFCLMNPLERMCDPYRESLSCAHTQNLNVKTQMGHFFDGFAGFFRSNLEKDSTKRYPLKCFLDIKRDSWFQFISLNFGKNRRWTESSFVLIDGELAPFQPPRFFNSLPDINFGWLLNQVKSLPFYLGKRTTSTGILVFAADSEVQLFYHTDKRVITGSEQFFFGELK